MTTSRRTVLGWTAAGLATAGGLRPARAAYPDRPITVIVPWAAGGGADTVTRFFVAGFEKELGVPVAVINRTGGGGITGHTAISTANPDGYTLGVISSELAFYQAMGLGTIGPDEFDLFSRLALLPAGVTVKADAPWKTLADVLAAIKEKPKGTYTSSGTGIGGSWHIAIGGLLKAAGMEADRVRWVPSQGGAPALQDLAAGGLSLFTGSPVEAKALAEGGRVRVLTIMSPERSPVFPTLPIPKDSGIDWSYANWFAFAAPKGLPADVRAHLAAAAKRAMTNPAVQATYTDRGIQPVWDEGDAFPIFLSGFTERGVAVLKDLGIAKA